MEMLHSDECAIKDPNENTGPLQIIYIYSYPKS